MLNPQFSFEEFDSDVNYHPRGFVDDSAVKPTYLFSAEDMGGGVIGAIDDLWSSYGFYPGSPIEKGASFLSPNDPQCFPEFMAIDGPQFDAVSTAIPSLEPPTVVNNGLQRPLMSDISELFAPKEKALPTSSSLELLKDYRASCNRFNGERINESFGKENNPIKVGGRELSTEEVMRVAAAHFIQLSTSREGDPSMLRLPFELSFSGLTGQEIKNVELASLLLAAAEKVCNQQYDRASNLLRQCYMLSSNIGNPVQRVVYYFSDALHERIDRETGRLSSKWPNGRGIMTAQEVIKAMLGNHPLQLICHKTLPFAQVLQFTSIQAIIDYMATAKRIHMIDLSIKHGLQWTILMQALATRPACPIEYLKISAVGLAEEVIAATGKRLSSFAESLSLPFEFKAVVAPDIKDLREGMFELREGEAVGIYSDMDMNSMIVRPESLENLMRVIWKLQPCVMMVIDVEGKHNSPSFINRFTEALFYFSAWFDCFDSIMERTDGNRMVLEGSFFSQGIRSMVATEGSERIVRHVGVSVWREFFARFGLAEADLNEHSVYQASLLLKQFPSGDSCTLDKDGKSLLIGWKGTPMHFISAWKFQKREWKV